jgi:NADPH-dependent F420 reductase
VNRTIAIIGGTGAQGSGLAWRWARAGETVVIGSRDPARAAACAESIRQRFPAARITGQSNADAVAQADIVVLTVPFPAHIRLLKQLRPALTRPAVLVDTTVPLEATLGGSPTRLLSLWKGSAAELTASLVPETVQVAAAFHTVSAELLQGEGPLESDVLVCADHALARRLTCQLAEKIPGVRAIDAGGLDGARLLEHLTALLIRLNVRYRITDAGVRFTGLPLSGTPYGQD